MDEPKAPKNPSDMSDDELVYDFVYWFKVYKAQGFLEPAERQRFIDLGKECKKRDVFDFSMILE